MSLSPSEEEALKAFEDGGKTTLRCKQLLQDSFHTFSLLERWESAESNVSSVASIIRKVQRQGHAYFATLSDSIFVATALTELAQEAEHLIGFLLNLKHTAEEIKEIKDFISGTRSLIQEALKKSRRVSDALCKVRRDVNEISASIPGEMAKLESVEKTKLIKNEALQRRIEHVRMAKNIATAAVAVVGGVSSVVFPPFLLIFPVLLPIGILVSEMYEQRSSKTVRKREDEILDCRHGLDQLQEIATCLSSLLKHVDSLTEFWVRSDTMLETIANGVHRIRGGSARLRLQATRDNWKKAADMYLDYATKLKCVVDIECAATASLRSQTSSASESRKPHGSDQAHKRITSTDLGRRNAIKASSRSSSKGSSSSGHSSC